MTDRQFIPIRIAVLTVSDTRQLADDKSGQTLVDRLTADNHISSQIAKYCPTSAIKSPTNSAHGAPTQTSTPSFPQGGTGLTGRDITVEAHRDVYEKEIDAFSTYFTMISAEKIGTSAIQSRACAGVAEGTYLFALPGSPWCLQRRMGSNPTIINSITAICPATLWKSCHALTNISVGNDQ